MKLKDLLKMTAETKIHFLIMAKEDDYIMSDFTVNYLDKYQKKLSDSIITRESYKDAEVDYFGVNSARKCLEIRCHI